ncbi:DNA adenine methylase [Kocuria massiliensis]|uniref:DNA adenine methylase n=1 Tax=Kocuria massiliensis TaxID=1926282 RepID=UPI0022B97D5B|nr:DNA adenine methylase [Kocuria massiliensis]
MKYMGSKSALLSGALGEILLHECATADRFVDLFAGSGAVAHFIAQRTEIPILTVDLQEYARILSAAIIERTDSLVGDIVLEEWLATSNASMAGAKNPIPLTAELVNAERAKADSFYQGFVTRHYGGHYYSFEQARTLDVLYAELPNSEPQRTVALAALLHAASVCAAAPGHTAQPFQPSKKLLPFIEQAWSRSVRDTVRNAVQRLAPAFAAVKGEARVGDAQSTVPTLGEGDFVFCDPPYSSVQYSRFYHVLEGIGRGGWAEVSGNGRAPARTLRKTSEFSMKSKAIAAMKNLLAGLRERGCRVMITFPDADASNGLSGQDIIAMAAEDWTVQPHYIDSVHSTLGGSNDGTRRGGRKRLREAVIVLTPRSTVVNVPLAVPGRSEPTAPRRAPIVVM